MERPKGVPDTGGNEFMILVGTPAYNGMVHIDYLKSVLGLVGIVDFEVMNIGNESLITRARNNIINYFYINPKYSHLLFLDGDVEIDASDVKKLIDWNLDAIGAAVPMKCLGENGDLIYNVYNPIQDDGHLYRADHVGSAVFLLSRDAVDTLIKISPRYLEGDLYKYDVFRVGVVEGRYLSEDYYVCQVLRDNGIDVYVDDSIIVHHQGMMKL